MGDIGGGLQAAASVADTSMTNAANIYMQNQANQFNAQQAGVQRNWAAGQQTQQNAFNAQQAAITRGFDASQSDINRQFQAGQQIQAEDYNTMMSDTAVQRRMADIKAAGVNPLLAASQLGGASTPVMSAPSGSAIGGPAASGGIAGGSSASAAGVARVSPLLQNLANLSLTSAQTSKTAQETKTEANRTGLVGSQATIARTDADIATLQDSPDMLMKKQQVLSAQLERDYSIAPDEAKIVANARLTAERAYEVQSLDIRGRELGNYGQQLTNEWQATQNQLSTLGLTAQRALNDQYIQAQRAALDRDQTDATIENSVLQGRKTGYGTAADGLAYLRALHSPVSSAVGVLQTPVGGSSGPAPPRGPLPSVRYGPFDQRP